MTDPPCSDQARLRGDPLVGTAPPARRWLLLEQDTAWSPQAFEGMPLAAQVRRGVSDAAAAAGARIMLIRRPGRRTSPVCLQRAWCLVDVAAAQPLRWGIWSYDEDLGEAVTAMQDSPSSDYPPIRAPGDDPELVLVCTHGRHDVCCATRGRPVAAALAQRWPEATWECSHTGGDRFAANVVLLPEGVVYGGLDPISAPEVVQSHHEGRPATTYLRGVAGHPPAVQAALIAVHQREGPLPWGSVHPVEHTARGRVHQVIVTAPHGRLEVTVQDRVSAPHQLTCRAPAPGPATVPTVLGLRTISA